MLVYSNRSYLLDGKIVVWVQDVDYMDNQAYIVGGSDNDDELMEGQWYDCNRLSPIPEDS